MSGTKFAVQKYLNEGWSPLPIPPKEKGPRIAGWETQDFTPADFADDDNIGVHLGKHTNGPGLYDVDLDDKLAALAADILLAPTDRIHGRPSKPRSHRFYTCDEPIDHYVMHGLGGNNDTIVELRGISPTSRSFTQTVLPPSVHPSGEQLAWESEGKPGHFKEAAPFLLQVRDIGIAVLLARGFPGPGHRHGPRMALAGYLFRAGLDELVIKAIGRAIMRMVGGDEQDWLDTCRTTIEKLKVDPQAPMTGGPALSQAMGADGPAIIKKCNLYLGRADQAAVDEVIENYNKRYFLVMANTTPCVADDGDPSAIKLLTYDSFRKKEIKNFMPDRTVKVKHAGKVTDKKKKGRPCADVWLEHADGRQFDQLVYSPPPLTHGPKDYNGWKGFKVAAVEGGFPLIEAHVRDIVCGGDNELYLWVMNWCAALVQRPGDHANTALILQGGQGTGKGFFAHDLLGGMFDLRHYLTVSSHEQFYGRFSGELLSGKCLCFLDEATWGGDKRDAGLLKDRITGDWITVDRKGIAAVKERNMLHLVIASNEDWPVGIDRDDRRFVALHVVNPQANDPAYFGPLYAELHSGGQGAFLHALNSLVICDELLRQPPDTAAKTALKIRSMPPEVEWWQEKLMNGIILASDKRWPKEIPRAAAHTDYQQYLQGLGVNRKLGPAKFFDKLQEMCPGIKWTKPHGKPRIGLCPTLDEARRQFEKYLKASIVWDADVQPALPADAEPDAEILNQDVPF